MIPNAMCGIGIGLHCGRGPTSLMYIEVTTETDPITTILRSKHPIFKHDSLIQLMGVNARLPPKPSAMSSSCAPRR